MVVSQTPNSHVNVSTTIILLRSLKSPTTNQPPTKPYTTSTITTHTMHTHTHTHQHQTTHTHTHTHTHTTHTQTYHDQIHTHSRPQPVHHHPTTTTTNHPITGTLHPNRHQSLTMSSTTTNHHNCSIKLPPPPPPNHPPRLLRLHYPPPPPQIALITGHIWPLLLKGRGGKGIVVYLAALLMLEPLGLILFGLIAFIASITPMPFSKVMIAAMAIPPLLTIWQGDLWVGLCLGIGYCLVVIAHTLPVHPRLSIKEEQI